MPELKLIKPKSRTNLQQARYLSLMKEARNIKKREQMRNYRANMTEKKKAQEKSEKVVRMRKCRNEKSEVEEEQETRRHQNQI